ncbi:TetR/AcrR family transcriptional regulator [Tomitella biformata]|uniref:TetR/AcrR family transcriptional regulator n=1 Tax=Tomitella biformata TaxID=630403 RepID=UPI00056F6181|nr:TetR/AcrR family transcriptional regulator [Tomitella biformata]
MSGRLTSAAQDRRARRQEATRQEILDAAWELSRELGLAGLTMRGLGGRVGMTAQSLYSYFASKNEIYDAMFAAANRDVLARVAVASGEGPESQLHQGIRTYFEFCVEDPVRYQLLYQRTIPGFAPSPVAYAPAQELLRLLAAHLAGLGLDGRVLDLMTAVIAGLAAQQLANEPGGDRWARLLDDAVEMVLRTGDPRQRTQ